MLNNRNDIITLKLKKTKKNLSHMKISKRFQNFDVFFNLVIGFFIFIS
jgi:hypothetical protein